MTYKTQDWCLHDVIDVLQKPFSTQIEFLPNGRKKVTGPQSVCSPWGMSYV